MACNVAAVVVLYNPDKDFFENLASYAGDVSVLYIIDNSPAPLESIPCNCTEYIWSDENIGISAALNLAAEKAIKAGFNYLLTMDQDSRAYPGMVSKLLACSSSDVGVVAPHLLLSPGDKPSHGGGCRQMQTVMTSGSLLNLNAYQYAGQFREDFFIDFVDIEYSLRLQRCGYKVLQCGSAFLAHNVGRQIGTGVFSITTHPALRKYYKTRNRFELWREYATDFPIYVLGDRLRFFLEFGRLILFEPEKWAKFRMMLKGMKDFRCCRFGRYSDGELV